MHRYVDKTVSATPTFDDGSIMVWGGVSLAGRTELVSVGNKFLLMQHTARSHGATIVQEYLYEISIPVLD